MLLKDKGFLNADKTAAQEVQKIEEVCNKTQGFVQSKYTVRVIHCIMITLIFILLTS